MPHTITVKKADGTQEEFQMAKLRNSLKRAGASETEVSDIAREMEEELFDGVTTEFLYRKAFELLRQREHTTAARYSLRRAMIGLGPTGFPFEDYLAELFRRQGYEAQTRSEIKGRCVTHEIDVIAFKEGECIVAEAKFHAQVGIKSDLQVVLYSHARFLDIAEASLGKKTLRKVTHSYVITNTKFTTTAIQYAKCAGMHLLSWDYPKKGNLQDMIQKTGLYPITVLQTLSQKEKQNLLAQGIVLCKDILDNGEVLSSVGIPRKKISAIIEEGARLCTIG